MNLIHSISLTTTSGDRSYEITADNSLKALLVAQRYAALQGLTVLGAKYHGTLEVFSEFKRQIKCGGDSTVQPRMHGTVQRSQPSVHGSRSGEGVSATERDGSVGGDRQTSSQAVGSQLRD